MAIVLGANQYGKAEVRLLHVSRDGASQDGASQDGASQDGGTHEITDLNVSVALSGDLAAVHLTGDNSAVLPTDAQKNTVFAFARRARRRPDRGFRAAAGPALRGVPGAISPARVTRGASTAGSGSAPSLLPPVGAGGDATARSAMTAAIVGGLRAARPGRAQLDRLGVLGFRPDRYTTLAETTDRILATAVTRGGGTPSASTRTGPGRTPGSGTCCSSVRRDVQPVAAADAVRDGTAGCSAAVPEIAEIRLSLPNKHHFLVDLSPFGLRNPGRCSSPPTGRTG